MAAHRSFPSVVPVTFGFIAYYVSYSSWEENNFCAIKPSHTGGFWEPLVVAYEHGKFNSVDSKNFVAFGGMFEVLFFVKTWVMRNVNFVVLADYFSVSIDHNCRIIV